MTFAKKQNFCPKCGYTFGEKKPGDLARSKCPKCGTNLNKWKKSSPYKSKKFYIICILPILIIGGMAFLFFTNKGVATELQQIRQPRPNSFDIGIDVSPTMNNEILSDFKIAIVSRLKNFIGETTVFYHVSTFGNPGCGTESIKELLSRHSPEDNLQFKLEVEEKIEKIALTAIPEDGRLTKPLTTPLHCYLKNTLPKSVGERIIIFSDLMNDDSDCRKQFAFPEKELLEFGANPRSQIIFFYPDPFFRSDNPELNDRLIEQQQEFISKIERMRSEGKIRAFFHHLPDNDQLRAVFMKMELQSAIPSTTFDVIWEKASRMFDTMVAAVRG